MPRWTIAVITAWDAETEEGDELYENVATVEAASEEEAIQIYGEAHPHHRDYDFIYARPEGTKW